MDTRTARVWCCVWLAGAVALAGCTDASTPLRVIPVEPAETRVATEEVQHGTVGEPTPDSLAVLVVDRYGNPVPGVSVRFQVEVGGGSVDPAVAETGVDGLARSEWTLGPVAGVQRVEAVVSPTVEAAVFSAFAAPGRPAEFSAVGGDGQAGPARSELAEPFEVRVRDGYGNPVEGVRVVWEVTAGDGAVDPDASVTDAGGIARTRFTLGPATGEHRVRARVDGLADVTFRAVAEEPIDFSVPFAYLVQSVQRPDGTVPLIAGRDAMLRVFVTADRAARVKPPEVRVDFFVHGERVATEMLSGPTDRVPLVPREDDPGSSWNLRVPGERIVPGLSFLVTVDADDGGSGSGHSGNTFPASGTPYPVDVRVVPPFRVVFVPIQPITSQEVGNVNASNADMYLTDALKLLPIADVEVSVHPTFTVSVSQVVTDRQWDTVLREVRQLRASESNEAYYYGVVPYKPGTSWCGVGFIGLAAAVGADAPSCGASTAAHEWGHNLDRLHAPCGNILDPDPLYPYPEAALGAYGFDIEANSVLSSPDRRDLMSYCRPWWISDYNFRAMLEFRLARESLVRWDIAPPKEPTLMLWGRIEDGAAVLEPAYEIDARPSLPSRSGPYRLQGLDAAGAVIFELSFEGEVLDHVDGVRLFSFAVPTSVAQPQRLARLRLSGPGVFVERVREPAIAAAPAPALEPAGRGQIRLQWDAASAPLIVVRDPTTGQILSFARGDAATIRSDAVEVELIVSDGVSNRSLRRIEIQR